LVPDRAIRQEIEYSVEFEALDEVRLLLPEQLMPSDDSPPLIRVSTTAGTILPMNGTGLTVGGQRRVRYQLPDPRLGQFAIVVEYPFNLPQVEGEVSSVKLPIVQSADCQFSETQLLVRGKGVGRARVNDEEWVPQDGRQPNAGWSTTQARTHVMLEMGTLAGSEGDGITVTRALVQSWLDTDGYNRSRAQYRIIAGEAEGVTVSLPKGVISDGIWWNQELLRPRISATNPSALQLSIPDSELDSESGLLTIDFHSDSDMPFDWSESHTLQWPSLPESVWIDQMIWEIILPADQHLFTTPAGYTPQDTWQRAGMTWQREPHDTFANLNQWIQNEEGPAEPREIAGGNSYRFLRLGPSRPLKFRTMRWWAIIFCGAGLTWIVGVILLKIPATRHVLTVPILATATLCTAIWYPTPVQLFLQPAILGIVLACMMVWIDSWARFRTNGAHRDASRVRAAIDFHWFRAGRSFGC